jgi:hypothetical protein
MVTLVNKQQVKAEIGNTVKLAAINEVSASYATVAVSTVAWLGRQVKELSIDGVKAQFNNIKNSNGTDANSWNFASVKATTVGALTAVAQGVKDVFTGSIGLGTCAAALSDTALERVFDLVEHYTNKSMTTKLRESVKVVAAGGVYYLSGVATLSAAPVAVASYGAYRATAHFAQKYLEKVKTA